jgi:endonuclease YncB( thermonuclease family)
MSSCRNVLATILLAAALCTRPEMGAAQEQEQAPARDVTRSKAIRTHRPRIPADFFKEESVRFERARIDKNGSIAADGHNLSLYGVGLLRRDKICTAEEGARWACGQRAFMALRNLVEGKSITCRFMHATMPARAICWAGDMDIASFLLSQGWAELADNVTEATYIEAVASAQNKKAGIWGNGSP